MIEKYAMLAVRMLVIIIWSLVGLILWIPLLVRVVFFYTAMVSSSMFSDISLDRSTEALEASSTFYIDGFKKIFKSNLSGSSSDPGIAKPSRTSYPHQPRNVGREKYHLTFHDVLVVSTNIFWSIIFWYLVKTVMSGDWQVLINNITIFFGSMSDRVLKNRN